jgi:hypothetical protein
MSMRRTIRGASVMLAPVLLLAASAAHASFLAGEALDSAANVLAWFVLIVMPPLGIALFWMVHVLPQKAAEKRHHPQKEAIHVLCLLSLLFGGLLWPIAWLWAYSRPVVAAMSTGTEKHEDYFIEHADLAESGELPMERVKAVRAELDGLEARGFLSEDLRILRDRLKRVEERHAAPVEGAI